MSRVNYKTLKQWFFEDAYQWCQEKFYDGVVHKWHSDESNEWGGALNSFDGNFKLPIENLMLYVIYIILRAGRNPYGHKVILNDIDKILAKNNLNDLISVLEEEEKQEFLYDLNLVLNNRELEE
ncbi:hypothetical protein Q7506_11700 [Glaesserella parasuis]|uniref:hypothetical protein n=1 Tax=Glaesserella parasuis TaxID=738 RepID=UPI002436D999|nr:hypothetical protein [Glaesserella parasuis]MDG6449177.1 hypothetical protein [Glaesserella parasuis]MDG6476929.1 hypothetical protein [Glaesserella parasuis]MDO9666178.1 hypothetical protein [Glaesserella parasuis]MDO9768522.1 hypothetical protein [Glaesserella parasuis]MDO9832364.1 hypothetical protein [Glaesserella parasuis]